jgi:hypothetical protein
MKPKVDQQVKLKPKFCKLLSEMYFRGAEVNPWATIKKVFPDGEGGYTYDVYVTRLGDGLVNKSVTVWAARNDFTVPRRAVT